MPGALSYSASGTMDWNPNLHPFSEIIRECKEETGLSLSTNQLRLFSVGVDAGRQYFQFTFVAEVPQTADEIINGAIHARDFGFEFEHMHIPVAFASNSIVSLIKQDVWEPAAQAGLLTLCAKRYGVGAVELALDPEFVRSRYRQTMLAEWERRALRRGRFAVMSDRYPSDELDNQSELYVAAVMQFLGPDIAFKDVVEFGPGIGRITRHLVGVAARLTCVDLSETMIARCKEGLGAAASRVSFHSCFAQDYHPAKKHDVAICSLVLIHNADDLSFKQMVESLKASAETLFLFEHCDPAARASSSTKTRSEAELLASFREYRVERRRDYRLFSDDLVFLKLLKS
jgi:ADP-ribose pyrophosphatase YjhB (NUDIX family)